ncbi:MAG: GTPase domain-containing protein [Zavarzinella sp.]
MLPNQDEIPYRPVAIDAEALRVVVFGMPEAGKSTFLGASLYTSEVHDPAMAGYIVDLTSGLTELRRRLFAEIHRHTEDELISYPVNFVRAGDPATHGISVVLYDCDGRRAFDLLKGPQSIKQSQRVGNLADTVLRADAMILVLDGSSDFEFIENDIQIFLHFLNMLKEIRAKELFVTDFPVHLVLSKCDLVGGGQLDRTSWEDAVWHLTKEVAKRFHDFLSDSTRLPGFGKVVLHVHPTAIRLPQHLQVPGEPAGTYGISQAFRATVLDAYQFRQQRDRAKFRLRATLLTILSFFAGIILLAVTMSSFRPDDTTLVQSLESRVLAIQRGEPKPPIQRLEVNRLHSLFHNLSGIRSDPDFPKLSDSLQEFVRTRLQEAELYLSFVEGISKIPPPSQALSLKELAFIEEQLAALKGPEEFPDWQATPEVQGFFRWRTEVKEIKAVAYRYNDFYVNLENQSAFLLYRAGKLSENWLKQWQELQLTAENVPTSALPAEVLERVIRYTEIVPVRAAWNSNRQKLEQVHLIAGCFGVLHHTKVASPFPKDVGALPIKDFEVVTNLLQKNFPQHQSWRLELIPDAFQEQLRAAIRIRLNQGIESGRKLALNSWQAATNSGKEIPSDWPKIAKVLTSEDAEAWREVMKWLQRLLEPEAPLLLEEATTFVNSPEFTLEFAEVRLEVPERLLPESIRLDGNIAILHTSNSGKEDLVLSQIDTSSVSNQVRQYPLKSKERLIIKYIPGNDLEIIARFKGLKTGREYQFVWKADSRTYQFDCFYQTPTYFVTALGGDKPTPAMGVQLKVIDGKIPTIPALLPQLKKFPLN